MIRQLSIIYKIDKTKERMCKSAETRLGGRIFSATVKKANIHRDVENWQLFGANLCIKVLPVGNSR
jgi:hypothetical protein